MLLFRNNTSSITPNAGPNRWGHPLAAVTFEGKRCGEKNRAVGTHPSRDPAGTHQSWGTHQSCGRPIPAGTHHFCRCPLREPASKPAMLLFRNNTSSITPNAGPNRRGHPLAAVAFEGKRCGEKNQAVGTHPEPSRGDTPAMPTGPQRGHTTFAAATRAKQPPSRRCCFSATTRPRSIQTSAPTAGATHWRQSPLKENAVGTNLSCGCPVPTVSRPDGVPSRRCPVPTGTHHNLSFRNAVTLQSIRQHQYHRPNRYFRYNSFDSHPDRTSHRIRQCSAKTTSSTSSFPYPGVLFVLVPDVFLCGSASRPPAEIHFGHLSPALFQRKTDLVADAQHLKAVGPTTANQRLTLAADRFRRPRSEWVPKPQKATAALKQRLPSSLRGPRSQQRTPHHSTHSQADEDRAASLSIVQSAATVHRGH